MGPKYNDFNNENATQVRGIVPSGIMIMTKHDQLVRVSINSIQCNSVICVCMHYSVLNVLISVHVVDPLSHLHAVIRMREWSIGTGLSI